MTWSVVLAKEREIEIDADNINKVVKIAKSKKTKEERIVSIRLNRGT